MKTTRKLTLTEFNLISTGIQSILKTTNHVKNIAHSCSFFATFGAAIMNTHLKIPCRAVAGAWFLRHPDGETTLAYGHIKDDIAGSSTEGFHMCVETDTHILDFMSPLYPESFRAYDLSRTLQRRMIQISIQEDAKSQDEYEAGKPIMTIGNSTAPGSAGHCPIFSVQQAAT